MLKQILKDISKDRDVTLLSDEASPCVVSEWLPTGCLALDTIMGEGFPVGRITELYGDTSTGKSLIAAQAAAYAIEDGHIVAYVDTESAVSLPIMQAVGVDTDKLIYFSPDTMEEVFEFFDALIESKKTRASDKLLFLIWDSIAATSVKQEQEAEFGKATMGRHANILSGALRKIARKISKERVCCLFLNQTREKIGVMYGDSETTFGGKAVPFYSSVRVRLKQGKKIKSGKDIVGIETKASVVKNKVAMPFREATLPIYFGFGIDDAEATFQYLKDNDLILGGAGGWYYLEGQEDSKFKRDDFPTIYDEQYDTILEMLRNDTPDN